MRVTRTSGVWASLSLVIPLSGLLSLGAAAQPAAQPSTGAPAQSKPAAAPKAAARNEFVPEEGQQGKDVIWLPTADAHVARMLDMAKATKNDYVIDLGSGDGRTVIAAAKRGISALGIEYNADMVELSKRRAQEAGVADKAKFEQGDIFEKDFTKATVLTLFLLPELNLRLRPTILNMKPGTRVVSNSFDMGDWQADSTSQSKQKCSQYCTAYLWIVPAKVVGSWKLSNGATVKLDQTFQMVTGTLSPAKGKPVKITKGKLNGQRLTFTAGGRTYVGRVNGDKIEGVAKRKSQAWSATRTAG